MRKRRRKLFGKEYKGAVTLDTILTKAYKLEIVLVIAALIQAVITMMYSVGPNYTKFVIYSRNFSSIVAFVFIGIYITFWFAYSSSKIHPTIVMKQFKVLTIIVFVLCVIKTILAVCYASIQFSINGFSWVYYVGEALGWAAIGTYFLIYLKNRKVLSAEEYEKKFDSHRSRMDDKIDAALKKSSNLDVE